MIKIKGRIDFFPEDVTKKHINQSSWKSVAIIKTDCDLDRYYSWFLKKRFNLELNKNLRGSHVTFINDKMPRTDFEQIGKIFNGKEIEFFIDITPKSNGVHWWLNVDCPEAENIREICGLERIPHFKFHFTLGYANEKFIDHSKYIYEQYKRYGM
ncbi:hypothetical protein EBU94_07405 [bacterium]|nr:hypothetical protein [bacterium]